MAALMIQGCGSDVGKSLIVAGLCRLFTNRGLTVRPFKPQNMSNNAAVTAEGGEIGRAQALQALACRTAPSVDMNPVLLKPQSEVGAQLIVRGQRAGEVAARDFRKDKKALLDIAVQSYRSLQQVADILVVEGAGSPAETNLRRHDIANMGFAEAVNLPVLLVGDIERGHVIASLVGAYEVLEPADRARIRGFIINKFRGDASLFDDGIGTIESRTGWKNMGVLPWLSLTHRLPAEDAVALDRAGRPGPDKRLNIAIPRFPHISNFDDFDPLALEPEVDVAFVPPGQALPSSADLIILPGTKSTIADLAFLRTQGWDIDVLAHVRQGKPLLGICGGYQMLGRNITDPHRIEGDRTAIEGLGLLDFETMMGEHKVLRECKGIDCINRAAFTGYEMHIGRSSGPATARSMLQFEDGSFDGAVSANGLVFGCHVHGLFNQPQFRGALLQSLGARSAGFAQHAGVDAALDELAAVLDRRLNISAIEQIANS